MNLAKSACLLALSLPCALWAQTAASQFDDAWTTVMSCDAYGQMPAYAWTFIGSIKDGAFRAQHSEEGAPGYLVIDGPIDTDGSAKLHARGTVTQSQAHGVFALKGNNYDYNTKPNSPAPPALARAKRAPASSAAPAHSALLGRLASLQLRRPRNNVPWSHS
jgi:hypothetical protein